MIAAPSGSSSQTQSNPSSTDETTIDLSLGAGQFGIPVPLIAPSRLIEEYAEVHPALGYNVAGIILSLVSNHLAGAEPGANGPETMTACLVRREDGAIVEVELELIACPQPSSAGLALRITGEQALPF